MSYLSSVGISIQVYDPLVIGGQHRGELAEEISAYSHTISAVGGYLSAEITLNAPMPLLEEWFRNGLGRHLAVIGQNGTQIFEGFVNKLSLTAGAVSSVRGPLIDVCNRASVVYTPILDDTVDPPIMGTKTETVIAEDTDSQAKYGILERVLSSGNCTPSEAEYVRDTYLADNKWPITSTDISIGNSSGAPTLKIELRGYNDWLNTWAYNDITTPVSVQISTKVQNILAADPNHFFSVDYTHIGFNGLLVPSFEDENRIAGQIIQGMVAMGDINGNRWLFQIYDNRIAFYSQVPTEVEYHYLLYSDGRSTITTPSNQHSVHPWDVRPGKWLMITDFLAGQILETSELRHDPRAVFIESVTFTAPYNLSINGNRLNRISQILAQMGLGGI